MMTRYYKVAGHTFAVNGSDELFKQMRNYEPFRCEGGKPLFTLTECRVVVPEYTEVFRMSKHLIYGYDASENDVIVFTSDKNTRTCLICSKECREGRLIMPDGISKVGVDRVIWMMFSLATAEKDTLVLHAVVVSCKGKGYLFIAPSGTGKSTHARLWLEHIEGTELVNDDYPVVRGDMVYGSPWGWKTPCNRNVSYPIGGIVLLSQSPYNKIRRLSGIEAYMYLTWSIIGGESSRIAEGLHQTANALASTIPMWHLECLPDEAAARLCHDTMLNKNGIE